MKSIGMRNIKTALAVTLSILISEFFKLDSPFYAAIAAVISMQILLQVPIGLEKTEC